MPPTFSYRTEMIDVRGPMKKGGRDLIHDSMSSVGADGWELVSVLPISGLHGPDSVILFFKRQDAERDSAPGARSRARAHPVGAKRVEA